MRRKESPGEVAMRLGLETQCAAVGRVIGETCPPGHGFALFMFEFGDGGSLAYISSAERENVLPVIEEWLGRQMGHPLAAENAKLRDRIRELEAERGARPT